tara:strand:- start:8620 stop:9342 length:723 start_codon:yes stop_codon:yes gene_type:complete
MKFVPEEWHNITSGRIFILGNGPSLLSQMELLKELNYEDTMTCNGMPNWMELPFEPTYHATTDVPLWKVLEKVSAPQWKDTNRFAFQRKGEEEHEAFYIVPTEPDNIQIDPAGMACLGDEWEGMRTARTTPLTIAQLAWWMGYRDLYYLGIEQSRGYVWDPDAVISFSGKAEFPVDKNPKYLMAIQRSARKMRKDIEKHGGAIFDCTPEGFLNETCPLKQTQNSVAVREILPYVSLGEVL